MGHKIIIITGDQGSGKTTFLQELIYGLTSRDIKVGGILAEGFWKNHERDHFKLIDLKSTKKILYCLKEPINGWEKLRQFYINPVGQKFGEDALAVENVKSSDVIVIDEIGPFELMGKGWAKSIESLLKILPEKMMVWVVRKMLVDEVSNCFKIIPLKVYNVEEFCAENVESYILKSL